MKALVVEPVLEMRAVLVEYLEKENFAVDATDKASVGLSLIDQNRYQLITSNAWSNDGSGLMMIKTIREKHIDDPIIICSARMCWQDLVVGYLAGADEYMGFPFHFSDFSTTIKRLMTGQDQPEDNEFFTVQERLFAYHKEGSSATDHELYNHEKHGWFIVNEAEEWSEQTQKRLARKQQIKKAQQFVFPETR